VTRMWDSRSTRKLRALPNPRGCPPRTTGKRPPRTRFRVHAARIPDQAAARPGDSTGSRGHSSTTKTTPSASISMSADDRGTLPGAADDGDMRYSAGEVSAAHTERWPHGPGFRAKLTWHFHRASARAASLGAPLTCKIANRIATAVDIRVSDGKCHDPAAGGFNLAGNCNGRHSVRRTRDSPVPVPGNLPHATHTTLKRLCSKATLHGARRIRSRRRAACVRLT